jgi:hypothetical protein
MVNLFHIDAARAASAVRLSAFEGIAKGEVKYDD